MAQTGPPPGLALRRTEQLLHVGEPRLLECLLELLVECRRRIAEVFFGQSTHVYRPKRN